MSLGNSSVSKAKQAREKRYTKNEDEWDFSALHRRRDAEEGTLLKVPIVIDTREQKPYTFEGYDVKIERRKLDTGDYSLAGMEDRFAIERKAKDDFIASVSRRHNQFKRCAKRADRFERPMPIVVETPLDVFKNGRCPQQVSINTITGTVSIWEEAYNVEWYFAANRSAAEIQTFRLLANFSNDLS